MLFNSEVFLFMFLPFTGLIYYLFLRKNIFLKNVFLLVMSLLFYAYAEPVCVFLMIGVILLHYVVGLLLYKFQNNVVLKNIILALTIIIDVVILGYFKYTNFFITNVNSILGMSIELKEIVLPIGISFYTFQAISYIVDISRGLVEPQLNPLYLGLYLSFFTSVVSGPIVRYETVKDQLENREETFKDLSFGINRFIVGLGKKVLLANQFAVIADAAFSATSKSVLFAWFGAIAYTLQIFFDFAGYSDMAIGLARMFGFRFQENFKYPYISKSIGEFWRRWHMSLQTWFRDYIYIPMGGSRVGAARLLLNMFVVWALTGLWHGANWTFIVWGLMYFVLLSLEKFTGFQERLGGFAHLYTMLFVMFGWVLFKSDTLGSALSYFGNMFGIGASSFVDATFFEYLQRYWVYLIAGFICCFPMIKNFNVRFRKNRIYSLIYIAAMTAILIVSIIFIFSNAYSPFIYMNF